MGKPFSKQALRATKPTFAAPAEQTSEADAKTNTPVDSTDQHYEMLTHDGSIWCSAFDAAWHYNSNPEICIGNQVKDRKTSHVRPLTPDDRRLIERLAAGLNKK